VPLPYGIVTMDFARKATESANTEKTCSRKENPSRRRELFGGRADYCGRELGPAIFTDNTVLSQANCHLGHGRLPQERIAGVEHVIVDARIETRSVGVRDVQEAIASRHC